MCVSDVERNDANMPKIFIKTPKMARKTKPDKKIKVDLLKCLIIARVMQSTFLKTPDSVTYW